MTPKRRSVFSLIFIVNCVSKFNLIRIKIKKKIKKKREFTFKQLFHTAIAVVVSGLHWRSTFDFSDMEQGWVSALPCQRVVLVVKSSY